MAKEFKEIVFTVNGPGELFGVVLPIVKALKNKYTDIVYTLFIVPCQFGSGLENTAAAKSGLFDNIFSVQQYKQLMLKNKLPENYKPLSGGLVFYAGGDGLHAVTIARKFGFPAYAYTHDPESLSFKASFLQVFTPDRDGNTMVDAALAKEISYQAEPIGSDKLTVGLYPGSRPAHLAVMVPFLSEVARLLNQKYPNIKFRWGVPETLLELFEKYKSQAYSPEVERPGDRYDLIVSLTGTNTAINAVLGIPMVILLPFNYPKLIPLMGVMGLITQIPLVGLLIKYLVLFLIKNKKGFISLPNMRAKRLIVPELKGFLNPVQVAGTMEKLLLNVTERQRIHKELPIFMGNPGAENIAGKLKELNQ